jgi:hypothetical protein
LVNVSRVKQKIPILLVDSSTTQKKNWNRLIRYRDLGKKMSCHINLPENSIPFGMIIFDKKEMTYACLKNQYPVYEQITLPL